ncbi:MAG: restriction endonuclease [Chloroflexi bacterium]|nr:restriction endonuclease [Chloroflexota bacterium]
MEEDGWVSELTASGPDAGVDIKCRRSKQDGTAESLVVQVKHFASGSIGAPVVRQILGAAAHENASGALVVTSTKFARGVESEFAGSVEMWNGDILAGRIDSLSDEQFERVARPYKLTLGRHALAEKDRLEQEQTRLGSEREIQQRNESICERQLNVLKRIEQAHDPWPKCPRCGNPTAVRLGKTYFWGCKRYPSCRGTRNVPTR